MPKEKIEDDDIPIAGEAFEKVVVCFGIYLGKLVSRGESNRHNTDHAPIIGQQGGDQQEKAGHHAVGEKIDDVIKQRPVDARHDLLDVDETGEHAVNGINHDRHTHPPQRHLQMLLLNGPEREQARAGTACGEKMNQPA